MIPFGPIADPTDSTLSNQSGLPNWFLLLHSKFAPARAVTNVGSHVSHISIFKEHHAPRFSPGCAINFQIINPQPSS